MDSVFIKSPRKKFKTYPLGYKMRQREGQVGIEIEVEGNIFRKGPEHGSSALTCKKLPTPWQYHHDGSLRGVDNAEYVTNGPIFFDEVPDAVKTLWDMFSEDGTVLDESNRTSVHVHLNVQKFHLNRLCSLLALYFSVEELLTQYCGEHRVGNLFCLRAKDASAIITRLKEYFRAYGDYRFSDGMHYCGLNPQAIHKLGSVEIRTLRGATDPSLVIEWVSILQRLYDLSAEYPNPKTVIEMFSQTGPIGYLDFVLGPHVPRVLEASGYTTEQANNAMYDGIRLVQELCYCVPWEEYEAVELKLDPFQREVKSDPYHEYVLNTLSTFSQTHIFQNTPSAPTPPPPVGHTPWIPVNNTSAIPMPTTTDPSEYTIDQYLEMTEIWASNYLSSEQFDMYLEVTAEHSESDDATLDEDDFEDHEEF